MSLLHSQVNKDSSESFWVLNAEDYPEYSGDNSWHKATVYFPHSVTEGDSFQVRNRNENKTIRFNERPVLAFSWIWSCVQ